MWLTPSTKALIANCRRAMDLLPGRVIDASKPRDKLAMAKEWEDVMVRCSCLRVECTLTQQQ
jgi:hypothetical protein